MNTDWTTTYCDTVNHTYSFIKTSQENLTSPDEWKSGRGWIILKDGKPNFVKDKDHTGNIRVDFNKEEEVVVPESNPKFK